MSTDNQGLLQGEVLAHYEPIQPSAPVDYNTKNNVNTNATREHPKKVPCGPPSTGKISYHYDSTNDVFTLEIGNISYKRQIELLNQRLKNQDDVFKKQAITAIICAILGFIFIFTVNQVFGVLFFLISVGSVGYIYYKRQRYKESIEFEKLQSDTGVDTTITITSSTVTFEGYGYSDFTQDKNYKKTSFTNYEVHTIIDKTSLNNVHDLKIIGFNLMTKQWDSTNNLFVNLLESNERLWLFNIFIHYGDGKVFLSENIQQKPIEIYNNNNMNELRDWFGFRTYYRIKLDELFNIYKQEAIEQEKERERQRLIMIEEEKNKPKHHRCDEWPARDNAYLCNSCGFGMGKDNCCVCGQWCGSTKIPAVLCHSCSFGIGKDNCVKCNQWCGSTKIPASMCHSCGFGMGKEKCSKTK